MSDLVVKEKQTVLDVAILAYGDSAALFELIKLNEALFTDTTKAVPEVELIPELRPGMLLQSNEGSAFFNTETVKALRSTAELASEPFLLELAIALGFDYEFDFEF